VKTGNGKGDSRPSRDTPKEKLEDGGTVPHDSANSSAFEEFLFLPTDGKTRSADNEERLAHQKIGTPERSNEKKVVKGNYGVFYRG